MKKAKVIISLILIIVIAFFGVSFAFVNGFISIGGKSINEAIEASTNDEVFIIGGGQIYKQAMNMADTMYLTIVDDICEDADTFFPKWGDEWKKTYDSPHLADEKHKYNYRFTIWKK